MNKFSTQNTGEHSGKANGAALAEKKEASATHTDVKESQVTAATEKKWPQQVKAAKSQWGKLSEAEILKSDGNPKQLSSLVQQRYDISQDVAEKQVNSFLDKCNLA